MTLDTHLEHLFLKRDLTYEGLGVKRYQDQPLGVQAWLVVKPKRVGSSKVLDPQTLGLSTYPDPRGLGIVRCQTYRFLGLTRS